MRLTGQLVLFGLLYGVAMGSFRGLVAESQWMRQIVYSAIKVPLLLTATFAISLPSFYVVNTLLGLRRDFGAAIRSLVAAQAGLAIVLASLAPFTLFWYASCRGYREALLFNGAMFAIASFTAQWLVRGYYRPLVANNPRHRQVLWCWLVVYMLVGIQMAWLLRPFIGSPAVEVRFLAARSVGQCLRVRRTAGVADDLSVARRASSVASEVANRGDEEAGENRDARCGNDDVPRHNGGNECGDSAHQKVNADGQAAKIAEEANVAVNAAQANAAAVRRPNVTANVRWPAALSAS